MPPTGDVPGARIPRSALDPTDSGAWHDEGAPGAWLAPSGSFGHETPLQTIENGHFLDDIDYSTEPPLHAGDSAASAASSS